MALNCKDTIYFSECVVLFNVANPNLSKTTKEYSNKHNQIILKIVCQRKKILLVII